MSTQTADRLKLIWPPVLIAVLFLSAWQLLVVVRDIKPYLLPAPSLIAENFFGDIALMWETALYTGTTAFLGLVFGTIVGLVMALLAQRFIVVNNLVTPLAAGLAAVPIIALTPILNNMFSITSRTPRVLVTAIIVLFPIFVNVTRGLIQVQPVQLELMRSMNAQPRTVLRALRIPNAIPFFFTAMKVAAPPRRHRGTGRRILRRPTTRTWLSNSWFGSQHRLRTSVGICSSSHHHRPDVLLDRRGHRAMDNTLDRQNTFGLTRRRRKYAQHRTQSLDSSCESRRSRCARAVGLQQLGLEL